MSSASVWLWPHATARICRSASAAIASGVGCGAYISFTDAAHKARAHQVPLSPRIAGSLYCRSSSGPFYVSGAGRIPLFLIPRCDEGIHGFPPQLAAPSRQLSGTYFTRGVPTLIFILKACSSPMSLLSVPSRGLRWSPWNRTSRAAMLTECQLRCLELALAKTL